MPDADFLKQNYSFAVVIRATPEQKQHFKELLYDEGFQVVYQKTSIVQLWITEAAPNGKE